MIEVSAGQLQQAIEAQHYCWARFARIASLSLEFEGQAAWKGAVHVLDLEDRPSASCAYAWSSPIEGSNKRRFYAVLHLPPIESAAVALRAAIVADYRRKG
jgi:hypothetical protein